MKLAVLLILLGASASAAAPPRIVAASGRWAALAGERQCDAASLSLLPASKTRLQGRASLTFDARARHGQFAAALSKPVPSGASVMLTIGDEPFLLVARGHERVEPRPGAGSRDHRRAAPRDADADRGAVGARAALHRPLRPRPARRPRSTPPPPALRRSQALVNR